MRLVILILVGCAVPRPDVVSVASGCDVPLRGSGVAISANEVVTVAHVVECEARVNGMPAFVEGGNSFYTVLATRERYRPVIRYRTLANGDSGTPLFDSNGALVCIVEKLIPDAYVRCVTVNEEE